MPIYIGVTKVAVSFWLAYLVKHAMRNDFLERELITRPLKV